MIQEYPHNVRGFYPIYVDTQADYWLNREQLIKQLYAAPLNRPIMVHFGMHGLSITECGLYQVLTEYLQKTGRPKIDIAIHSPNLLENDLFYNHFTWPISDEFYYAGGYWVENPQQPNDTACRFGHFVGRPTTARIKMFYDIEKYKLTDQFFLSRLNDAGPPYWEFDFAHYDHINKWIDSSAEVEQFIKWYNNLKICSIDNLSIDDQYDVTKTSRTNLVKQSSRYFLDVVFETWTVGKTFVPTEKIIRSLVAEKPFIVFSSKGYLKNLQKIGFRTFGELWDESYDQLELRPRYEAILQLVRDLSALSTKDFVNLMTQTQEITQHNKNLLKMLNERWYRTSDFINNSIHEYHIS